MEEDGYDETICPFDFDKAGMIVDDEIFDRLVAPLPSGVKLTAVLDCCHSGTGLDLPFTLQKKRQHDGIGRCWAEEDNPCHSAGDVLLISGCQDEQTSSDGGGSYTQPMGAMTTALCNSLQRSPVMNHLELMDQLRSELRRGGFRQNPMLTASQRFDPQKLFSPCEGIEGNQNPVLGRHFRKKKKPKRASLLHGGLGQMLMAGAVGFLVADDVAELAGVATGLAIGGTELVANGAAGLFGGLFEDFGGLFGDE
jgi:hypothetical protein